MTLSKVIIPAAVLVGLLIGAYFFLQPSEKVQENTVLATVKKGKFVIKVTATGELKAKRSEKIRAPQGMRPAGIFETTIQSLVPEGTIVNEGDYVASLDRTELANKMSNVQTEIEKIQTQLEQAKIDTAIDMRSIRDQLINLGFTKKEKLLNVEQNKFEPQSVIQQTQLDLERTERDYGQLLKNYELKQKQAVAKIQEIDALLRQNQRQLKMLSDLSDKFNINAPKSGMVIYARNWNGKKEPGSRVSAWNPVVAELPDLSDMISKTYVNEVDISKVKVGQDVELQVDAFPDNKYSGQVLQVANIGEQLRGYDAKVFEVVVQVNEVDSILRPAMTTSNEIVTETFQDATFIPLEALQTDSLTFVYKNENGATVRQEVITDLTNNNEIIISYGLTEGDEIHLIAPSDPDNYPFIPLDPAIKEKIRKEQEAAEKERQAKAEERKKKMDNSSPIPSDNGGGEDFFIIMD